MGDGAEIVGETPRLRLRRLRPADLDDLASMAGDPDQMRFYPRPKSREEVREWLEWNLGLYEEVGFGTWCLESPDGSFLGYAGLRPLTLEGAQEVELAWHLRKAHWGQGLATEAASAAIELGFERFGLSRLVAIIHPDNRSSRRVALRLGMAEGHRLVVDGEPVLRYCIEA